MTKRRPEIELRHLRYFVAAAEQGSFRKAGISLAVQESAVSRRIRDLEDQLGASLFQRHNGGVELTLAGDIFLRRARAALLNIYEGARDVNAIGRAEVECIRIGVVPALRSAFLIDILRAFDRLHTSVHIDLVETEPFDQIAAVRRREMDLAFTADIADWPGCDVTPLWTEQIFVALSDGHYLTRWTELSWQHLIDQCFIVSQPRRVQGHYDSLNERLLGIEGRLEIKILDLCREALLPLVALGRGLALTSETAAAVNFPGVVYRPLGGEMLCFAAVWAPGNDNPALRSLLSMARKLASITERHGPVVA